MSEIRAASEADPLVHVFTNLTGVGNIEVNAFQRLSRVVVQKSIREGFGLVVSEAMWKGTPVLAGRAGGIPLQMADGAGGILVDSVEEYASAIVELLRGADRSREVGMRGRERVRTQFLLPRLLLDELVLAAELIAGRRPIATVWQGHRDPVCGMAIGEEEDAPAEMVAGATYRFCSAECRERFRRDPDRYRLPQASERASGGG